MSLYSGGTKSHEIVFHLDVFYGNQSRFEAVLAKLCLPNNNAIDLRKSAISNNLPQVT